MISSYGPKFKTLFDYMGTVDEKFRQIGDLKHQNEFDFEDFKNNFTLKTKVIQETISSHS